MIKNWELWLVVLLAFCLRVVALNSFPAGFTPDEASFAYDAYSILHTGKDQWGHTFPLVLESFGDFKPPLYAYISVPFVWLFGLTKFAIRLPNALFGTAAVAVVYFLAAQFRSKKLYQLPLLSAATLAVSPWHVLLSRGAFEANLASFFVPLGILFFLKSTKKQKYLVWSATIFGLSLFAYHSTRVITPLLVGVLVALYFNDLRIVSAKTKLLALAVFAVFVIATGYTFLQGAGTRAADISIAGGAAQAQAAGRLAAIESGTNPTIARLTHNKYIVIGQRFVNNYAQYYSPNFLVTNGPAEATYGMLPGIGVLNRIEPLFFLFFIFVAFRFRAEKWIWFMVVWLVMAPIPAALAAGVGYAANRAATMLPVVQLAIAVSLAYLFAHSKKYSLSKRARVPFLVAYFVALVFSQLLTYVARVDHTRSAMLAGNLEVAQWVTQNQQGNIFVSKRLSEPHIYFAFAGAVKPKLFQEATQSWDYQAVNKQFVDQLDFYSLDRFDFGSMEDDKIEFNNYAALVGFENETANFGDVVFSTGPDTRRVVVVKPYD